MFNKIYKRSCGKKFKRLNTDVIDLYYAHRIDQNTPIEETIEAMSQLVKEGKIKYLGLSECTADELKKAHAIHPISALQSEFSLLTQDIKRDITTYKRVKYHFNSFCSIKSWSYVK